MNCWLMQALFLNPDWLPFHITLPVYILGMVFHGVEYPFGQLRSPVLAMLPLLEFLGFFVDVLNARGGGSKKIFLGLL